MIGSPKGRVVFSAKLDRWMMSIFKVVIWLILVAIFVWIYYSKIYKFTGILEPDAMDYGQMARHNLRGEWFQTSFVRPITFWITDCSKGVPDISNPPLYSLYLMPLIAFFGARDIILVGGCVLMHLAVVLLLFLFGRTVFNRKVAFYSMFFYLSCSVVLFAVLSGLPQMMAAFLILLLMFVLYFCEEKKWWPAPVAGAVTGLCFLTSYSYGLFAIPVLIYLIFTMGKKRLISAAAYAAVFLVVIFPWLYRNASITGGPFFNLHMFRPYQMAQSYDAGGEQPYLVGSYGYLRSLSPSIIEVDIPSKKVTDNFLRSLKNNYWNFFRNTTGNLLAVFFMAGIFYRYRNRRIDKLRYLFYGIVFLELISLSVMAPDSLKLVPFVPFIILMGTAFFFASLERIRPKFFLSRIGITALFVILSLYPTFAELRPNSYVRYQELLWFPRPVAKETLPAMAEQDEVVLTNVPWMVAWYADMEAIWVPPTYEDMKRLKAVRPYSLAYLAPFIFSMEQDFDKELWRQIFLRKTLPEEFPLKYLVNPFVDEQGQQIVTEQEIKESRRYRVYRHGLQQNSVIILSDIPSSKRIRKIFEQPKEKEIEEPKEKNEQPAPAL